MYLPTEQNTLLWSRLHVFLSLSALLNPTMLVSSTSDSAVHSGYSNYQMLMLQKRNTETNVLLFFSSWVWLICPCPTELEWQEEELTELHLRYFSANVNLNVHLFSLTKIFMSRFLLILQMLCVHQLRNNLKWCSSAENSNVIIHSIIELQFKVSNGKDFLNSFLNATQPCLKHDVSVFTLSHSFSLHWWAEFVSVLHALFRFRPYPSLTDLMWELEQRCIFFIHSLSRLYPALYLCCILHCSSAGLQETTVHN